MLGNICVTDVKVIELCFDNPNGALEVAGKVVKEHPEAVHTVVTWSDLRSNASVLHIHVLEDRLHELLDRPHIKGSDGTMLVTALQTV